MKSSFKKTITLTYTAFILAIMPIQNAKAIEAVELKVSRLGDVELPCGSLSEEALLMREIIIATEEIKDNSDLKSHGINAAAGIGSFLIGSATGGIGLAAAGFLINQTNKEDASDANGVQDIAKQRRGLMLGIFNAKGCFGPIEHALQDGFIPPAEKKSISVANIEPASGNTQNNSTSQNKPRYNQ